MKKLFVFSLSCLLLPALFYACKAPMQISGGEIYDYIVMEPTIIKGYRIPDKAPDYRIHNARIEADKLLFDCDFKGLCNDHSFELIFDGMYMKSLPMKAVLYLQHNTEDTCMQNQSISLKFNLKNLMPPGHDHLVIHLFGFDQELHYVKNNEIQ